MELFDLLLAAPHYLTMEEGRADLVADYLTGDPKTVEIGVLPDAGCARIVPAARAVADLLAEFAAPALRADRKTCWMPSGSRRHRCRKRAEESEVSRSRRSTARYLRPRRGANRRRPFPSLTASS
jgi:hypothetical protein